MTSAKFRVINFLGLSPNETKLEIQGIHMNYYGYDKLTEIATILAF